MSTHSRIVSLFLAGALLSLPEPMAAQDPDPAAPKPQEQPPPPAPPTDTANVKVTLKEGTAVPLKLAQKLTSKTAFVDEPVEFVLTEDLKVGDAVVARKGARVLGVVTEGKKSEKERRDANQLSMRFDHMKLGDSIVKLRGQQAGTGKRDAAKMVGFTILFGLSGLAASSGKKFVIPEGTPATAFVDEDIELPVLAPLTN